MYPRPADADAQLGATLQTATFDISEDGDAVMLSDQSTQVTAPPPRIAARFYHPTNNRRRSSAASSRRNSLSSTHSHHSHHSFRGSQSSHVAQDLRRASIIETRKARLADRAAHAEKVRLRAALVKSAPRISNREERAVAAQQARERYLAQVASACAEEVKRAKRVAEDMKEKREAEGRKLRGDMEERLAEAEKRRTEYQRNLKRARAPSAPRSDGTRLSVVPERAMDVEDAAKHLQHAWRIRSRRLTVRTFLDLPLSLEGVRDMSFEEVGTLLSNEKVLTSTARVLHLCGLHETIGTEVDESARIRTFLSAFLILGHPAQVLSHDGDQEQDLIAKSRDLIISFQDLLSCLNTSNQYLPPPSKFQASSEAYNAFFSAFTSWKAHDSTVLVGTMVAQYVELDLIWQRIKDDTEEVVKAEYREGIRDNQILLLARIKRLAGPERAKLLIMGAIRRSRKSKSSRPAGNARPRAAPSEQSVTPQSVVHEPDQAARVSSNVPETDINNQESSHQAKELMKVISSLPENRQLVHELAINKEYRIDTASLMNSPTRKTVSRAVYEQMRLDVPNGLGSQWTVAMAENIRERLQRLLSPETHLYSLITEALDPVIVQRECSVGNFSYERFFSFLLSILPKLCAPFRDADLQNLAQDQGGDEIDRLSRFMDFIDLMSVDYANFLLQQSAPRLIEEAPGYEQRRFAQEIDERTVSLQSTEIWWTRAREKVMAEAQRRDPEGVDHPANRPSWGKIYTQALTDLSITYPESTNAGSTSDDFPATLHLDRDRILNLRVDTLRIVVIGSILLSAKNLLKRDVCAQWNAEAQRMWDVLAKEEEEDDDNNENPHHSNIPPKATSLVSIVEASHVLPPPTKSALLSFITRLLTQLHQRHTSTTNGSPSLSNPVAKLLLHRLRTHVYARLAATSAGERVRVASTASEVLARSGLAEFVGRVGEMVEVLSKVGELDRTSHGTWYDEIARRCDDARC
ncbi:MAG: hypothetical protein M1837_000888 [Sclerophora amabilis]|nr:MAG: hypothetical protein M1837_000888 [Sclerophora amabilis]